MKLLFRTRRLKVSRYGSENSVFGDGLDWNIHEGERWAVVGRVGSGKSTLGQAISGSLRWTDMEGRSVSPFTVSGFTVKFMAFQERSIAYGKHNIADRFHSFSGDGEELDVARFLLDAAMERRVDVILTDLDGSPMNRNRVALDTNPLDLLNGKARKLAETFRLKELLAMPLLRLSNGQLMRTRLAKNLLFSDDHDSNLIILDEVFMGLDSQMRKDISLMLGELALDEDFPNIMLLLRPQDELPPWITHVMKLENMKSTFIGTKEAYLNSLPPVEVKPSTKPPAKNHAENTRRSSEPSSVLAQLEDVRVVANDGGVILDSINWTVKSGERWGLTGPNGSGKSTLLAILTGDHPQAYSNKVVLFGSQRGTPGVSLWDIKDKIGALSPEFHMHFISKIGSGTFGYHDKFTLRDAIATGFGMGGVFCKRFTHLDTPYQSRVNEMMEYFRLVEKGDTDFRALSVGEQRIGLVLRALAKQPSLIILDEPFQGVDESLVELTHSWLHQDLTQSQGLILVTHYDQEIPDFVLHRIALDQGRRVV